MEDNGQNGQNGQANGHNGDIPEIGKRVQRVNREAGDIGDLATKGEMLRLERAFREKWPIPAGLRAKCIERMEAILNTGGLEHRAYINATKVLIQADVANIRREQMELEAEDRGASLNLDTLRVALRAQASGMIPQDSVQGVKSGVISQGDSPQVIENKGDK
jgi:hypothetical protein